MESRYTMLYGLMDGIWKLLHIHHSVTDAGLSAGNRLRIDILV